MADGMNLIDHIAGEMYVSYSLQLHTMVFCEFV